MSRFPITQLLSLILARSRIALMNTDNYLSEFLHGSHNEPKPETTPGLETASENPQSISESMEPVNAPQMMHEIVSFIRRYLVCSDHQLTVLALWITCTWRFLHFRTAPYLDIRSPEPQSGKTVCLQVLKALCNEPLFLTGADPKTLIFRFLEGRDLESVGKWKKQLPEDAAFTELLDDCHHGFGPSERQILVAMLNCGSRSDLFYCTADNEYWLFSPKALAGNSPLPRSLASRCIPILLHRKKPGDVVIPFPPGDAPV